MFKVKIRSGFVSNSSSSSFVCDVCGAAESGMDAPAYDLGYVECPSCGHTICMSCLLKEVDKHVIDEEYAHAIELIKSCKKDCNQFKEKVENLKEFIDNDYKDIELLLDTFHCIDCDINIVRAICPICNMAVVIDSDLLKYIFKNYNLDKDDVVNNIKKFKTYDDFLKSLNE